MANSKIHYFDGLVTHMRAGPRRHEFNYKYRSLYLTNVYDFKSNMMRIPESPFFNYEFNQSKKYFEIINKINELISNYHLDPRLLRLDLFKTPDIGLRKAFNPVCFWALKNEGDCILFIAEVTNTFYEKECYEISNFSKALSSDRWYEIDKKMYVSPFTEKSGFYKFKISLNPFNVRISQFSSVHQAEIITSIEGPLKEMEKGLRGVQLFKLFCNSSMVLFRIHLQAFILWIKRFRVFPHGDSGYVD